MRSWIARTIVVATALTLLFAVGSSTAGAVTWTNTGSTTIHATGFGTLVSVGSNFIICSGSTLTSTAATDFTGFTYSLPGTLTYSPCTLAGQNTYVHCGFTLTGTSFSSGVTTGADDLTCTVRLTASNTALCHIEGTLVGHYVNPNAPTFTPGTFTLTTSNDLTVTDAPGVHCLMGTGPAHAAHQTLSVTSVAGSPIINRQ